MSKRKKDFGLNEDDFGILCICALRYCQGRETYMPSMVRDIVRPNLSKLSDKDIDVLIQDCEFQKSMNLYGSETIDKPGWLRWEEEVRDEKKRREHIKLAY